LPEGEGMQKEEKMQKKMPGYDNVFKTMKHRHKKPFSPIINPKIKTAHYRRTLWQSF
jgi:hypothetical protein